MPCRAWQGLAASVSEPHSASALIGGALLDIWNLREGHAPDVSAGTAGGSGMACGADALQGMRWATLPIEALVGKLAGKDMPQKQEPQKSRLFVAWLAEREAVKLGFW